MHLGVILPNYGPGSTPDGIRQVAAAAEEAGLDSVWATEHILVGPEARDPYARVFDPLVALSWITGLTTRIGLGTSVLILPLHHPIELAKEAAALQELSGGRFRLGVGLGWHEDEFRFMGYPFHGRGHRADEAIRVMRALWRGETSFHGEHWSFENASFEPLPEPPPEVWIGGGSGRAIRRALELGAVWHPSRSVGPDDVRTVKGEHPELRIVPRTTPERLDAFLEAGADGGVLTVPSVDVLTELARRYR